MTNEQNIIVVPVPVDAYNIKYTAGKKWGYPYSTLYYTRGGFRHHAHIDSFNGEGTFLGCVSFKDGVYDIPFDPEPFMKGANIIQRVNRERIFVVDLKNMGHYWVNPLGEKPKEIDYWENVLLKDGIEDTILHEREYAYDLLEWRAAQEKCLRPAQKLAVMKIGG